MAEAQVDTLMVKVVADFKEYYKDMEKAGSQADRLGNRVATALGEALSGSKSLEDTFKSMLLGMSKDIFDTSIQPLQVLAKSLFSNLTSNFFTSMTSFMQSSFISQAGITPFANGGIVSSPTLFPMASGYGLMGEAGAEAIMPLKRGSDGRLGIQATGASNPVSIVMNISTPDANSFQKSENQIATKLARAVGRGRRGL